MCIIYLKMQTCNQWPCICPNIGRRMLCQKRMRQRLAQQQAQLAEPFWGQSQEKSEEPRKWLYTESEVEAKQKEEEKGILQKVQEAIWGEQQEEQQEEELEEEGRSVWNMFSSWLAGEPDEEKTYSVFRGERPSPTAATDHWLSQN